MVQRAVAALEFGTLSLGLVEGRCIGGVRHTSGTLRHGSLASLGIRTPPAALSRLAVFLPSAAIFFPMTAAAKTWDYVAWASF